MVSVGAQCPWADSAFPVTLWHARALALSPCQVRIQKACATSGSPHQLGNLPRQAVECVCVLISSLTFIKHHCLRAIDASRYCSCPFISRPPHPSPCLPPDMAKVSSDGLAWTAKRVRSQFHSFPSSNTDFWNRDTCNFGSYLNLVFLETSFLPPFLTYQNCTYTTRLSSSPASSKKISPGYFQTLLTESFHFSESNDQVIMY